MPLFIVEFDLTARCPLTVEDGDAVVDKGHSSVTVRNVEADAESDAADKARPKANALLDELCQLSGIGLEIGNSWTVMPQDSPETRHILPRLKVKLTAKGGHRRRYPRTLREVTTKASDAKAYYRKAAISKDPFDRFRNSYLAIENVASKIQAARGKPYRRELDSLTFALQQCFGSDSRTLEEYTHVYGFKNSGDILRDVATFLYKTNRVQLNHSKASETKKIPFDPRDEWEVLVSLTLAEYVAKSLISYEDRHLSS